ncbi:MAG: gamma-glutamylcyclotransferase [Candidatus Pelagibacterales bacterium]|nr:MAG: gamma-glutamylcyclotransferase [Pelagibacterales bacterium]
MIYYFAYGSNLHHLQMKRRCPNCQFIKKIILHNYDLTFRSKYGAADIEKKDGKKVYGALYIISKSAEKKLDIYEEYPTLYKKMFFKYQGKKVMTYIMPKKTKLVPPTTRYLNIIKQGYKDCKLNLKSLNAALQPLKHLQR